MCKSASHLAANMNHTTAFQIACASKETSSWLGSRLDADMGQSSELKHADKILCHFLSVAGRRMQTNGGFAPTPAVL
jgi:hypothetical protein